MAGWQWTRRVGIPSPDASRRQVVHVLAAALLPISRPLAVTGRTAPARVPGCDGKPAMDNKRCPRGRQTRCGGLRGCVCAKTVGGDKQCIYLLGVACPMQDDCDSDRDCRRGEVCIRIAGCCGGHVRRHACVSLCSAVA